MKYAICFLSILWCLTGQAQQAPRDQIMQTLQTQTAAWNRGDLEEFMQGYWQSDSLMFIGKSGLTYGWRQTLDNYKKNYPDARTMGQLRFSDIIIRPAGAEEAWFVVGRWQLAREEEKGDLAGYFSLLWERKNGEWVIVADHSS